MILPRTIRSLGFILIPCFPLIQLLSLNSPVSLVSLTRFSTKFPDVFFPVLDGKEWFAIEQELRIRRWYSMRFLSLSFRVYMWWDHCVILSNKGVSASSVPLVIPQWWSHRLQFKDMLTLIMQETRNYQYRYSLPLQSVYRVLKTLGLIFLTIPFYFSVILLLRSNRSFRSHLYSGWPLVTSFICLLPSSPSSHTILTIIWSNIPAMCSSNVALWVTFSFLNMCTS